MSLEVSIVSTVREFYENVPEVVNDKAMVSGVFVYFSVSTINAYYGIRNVGQ